MALCVYLAPYLFPVRHIPAYLPDIQGQTAVYLGWLNMCNVGAFYILPGIISPAQDYANRGNTKPSGHLSTPHSEGPKGSGGDSRERPALGFFSFDDKLIAWFEDGQFKYYRRG